MKCTLLDLSRRPSVITPEAQGTVASSSETKAPSSSSPSHSGADHLMQNLNAHGNMDEEMQVKESVTKMEVDPTDSQSDEEQSM